MVFPSKHYFQIEADLVLFKKMLQEYHSNPAVGKRSQTDFSTKDKSFPDVDTLNSSIIAKGNPTFKENEQYAYLYRRKALFLYVIFVIIALEWIFRDTFFGDAARWDWSLAIIALFLVIVTLATTGLSFALKRRNRKEYKSDPMSEKEKVYVINEDGIVYVPGENFVQYSWKDFRKIREYNNMFIFYVLPQRALLLPFRLFESPKDVERVKELIRKRVNSKIVKFKG